MFIGVLYSSVKKIVNFLFILALISCSKNKGLKNSDTSSSVDTVYIKEAVNNRKTKIQNYTKTVEIFHKGSSLKEKGKLKNDTLKTGIWSYYEDGKLNRKHEYLYIDNSNYDFEDSAEYVNQAWFYNENEEVAGGSYYQIEGLKDEYKLGEKVIINIFTPYRYFDGLDSELFLLYSREEFDKGFVNRNDIKFDTIWNATKRFPSIFGDDDHKFNILFAIENEKVGDFKLSGILTEQALDFTENDTLTRYREMFLELEFKVKDTVK